MGLDQYLDKRHYVQRWDHIPATEQFDVQTTRGGAPYTQIKPERVKYVVEQIAYWRKANAIHQWFVTHVQDGEDDCGEYYVSREKLKQLLDTCREALASANPETILPTQSGFFFGSTDYDEWYRRNLEYTIKTLSAALAEPDQDSWHSSFYYSSSW